MSKIRIDALLVARGLAESREKAQRMILAGEVSRNGQVISKPGTRLDSDSTVDVRQKSRYVSRGGLKMEGAIEAFGMDVAGKTCLDIGASTGGFTDCLLQNGAAKVYAYDVGTNQLVWKLRSDPRVVSREKFNCRYMTIEDIGEQVDLVVTDVSFISLTKILGPAFDVLKPGGNIMCLVKPQFELQPEDIGAGGIVRDPALHERAVARIREFVTEELGQYWLAVVDSPITGMEGNREFLALLGKKE